MNDTALMQVGRNCLKTFVGLANPEHLCSMAEMLFSASDLLSAAEDDGFEGGGMRAFTSVDSFMPFVACSIRRDGWLSRGAAFERGSIEASTASMALNFGVFATSTTPGRLEPTEKDYNVAAATIDFVADYFETRNVADLTDYENSLRVAMASGIVHPKFVGIIASAIQFYNKDVERRAKNESWAKMVASSRFQGVVGERSVFENLKVLAYRTWESSFGVTHFYSFVSPEGHAFTYFASRDMNLSVGQTISLKATVKKHERYTPKFEGAPTYEQTTITRAALVTRAVVKSVESVVKEETKCVSGPHFENSAGEHSNSYYGDFTKSVPGVWEDVKVTYHLYHFETVDGRKFLLTSKSKKKALVPGVESVVEYVDGYVGKGEQPVSLVR